jgi:hypothetical protein
MTWLHGAWMALLGLVAVPAIIHLLSRRKLRVVPFALVTLLEQSRRRTQRHVRMRNLLLWLLRTLLVLALVLIFLGPARSRDRDQLTSSPSSVVVVVDVTASMMAKVSSALGGDSSVLDVAKDGVRSAVAALPEDVAVGLLSCGATPTVLVPAEFSRGEVLRALDDLQPTFAAGTMSSCIGAALAIARPTVGPSTTRVLLASDGRASSLGMAAALAADGIEVEWLSAPREAALSITNHAVLSVSTHSRGPDLAVEASLWVPPDEASVLVDARLGDATIARSTVSGLAQPQTRPFVIADQNPDTSSPMQLTVAMPADAFPHDDAVVLALDAQTIVDVLIVDGAPETVPLRDEVHYLLQAIHQAGDRHAHIRERVVTVDQLLPSDLATDCQGPACADGQVVVMANVAAVSDVFAAALRSFVEAGGGLWITSGDQVDVRAYANLDGLLPARLRGTKELALLDDAAVVEPLGMARVRSDHPIFSSLAVSAADAGVPGLGRVRTRALMLVEPNDGRAAEVLMSFSNDAPALIERTVGAGKVLLLATSIDRDWSDLAIRPGFLPFVETTVLHLAGALVEPAPRWQRVGEPRAIRAPGATAVDITLPSGESVSVAVDATGAAMVPTTAIPGPYRVSVLRGQEAQVRSPRSQRSFTVLVAAEESDFTVATEADLRSSLPTGARWRASDDHNQPQPLWPWLMLAAVLMFTIESAVLWQRSHRSAGR